MSLSGWLAGCEAQRVESPLVLLRLGEPDFVDLFADDLAWALGFGSALNSPMEAVS